MTPTQLQRLLRLTRQLQDLATETGTVFTIEANHGDKHGLVAFHTKHGADVLPPYPIVNIAEHSDFTTTDYGVEGVGLRVFRQKK